MEVELIEIRQFLEQRNPFNHLSAELLDDLPKDIEIRYLRRGGAFPPKDGYLYLVRSGAIEIFDTEDELCEKLDEGAMYSVSCQLVNISQCVRGEAVEDTLLYLLSCDRLKALCRESKSFSEHFSSTVKERLKAAVMTVQESSDDPTVAAMMISVGSLIRKTPIAIESGMNIRETAALMSNKDVSSVMIMQGDELIGLVTDRDLRKRCVAIGLTGREPIDQIMTRDPQTIDANTLTAQALMMMTRKHFHHLPVTRDGKLVGMITATDLANHQSSNSAYLAADVRKAKSVNDLVEVSSRLPKLHLNLASASVTARHIGEAVSCLTDSITGRLLEMAEAELGKPPVPYVWMAGGSQARREQSSHSDQDNALLLSDDVRPEHDEYFAALAKFVTDGLNACGFVYCPGDAMASNPEWRQPLRTWISYFDKWITAPEPKSVMLSNIFFDLRPVKGDMDLFVPLKQSIQQKSQENRIFLAYMMANAMSHRPPLGFFRQFVLERGGEHDETLDLKHRGIVPITDIARILALSLGKEPVNTVDRLRTCAGTDALSTDMAENLEDALEFIATLRILHQAEQIKRGGKADNYVPPSELSELEREHLKHAFRVIQTMQETMVKRFGADKLG